MGPLAPPARDGTAEFPLPLPLGRPLAPGRLARKAKARGHRTPREPPGRGGFDKGTLAAALIGHCGQARSQPDSRTSVRAAAPCQIRRSVGAKRTACRPVPSTREPTYERN
jgi:hypothetical protein